MNVKAMPNSASASMELHAQITTGTYEYIAPTAALLEKAKAQTPSMQYILTHAPTSDFFALFLRASIMSGAHITEINGFEGIGLMLPPHANPSNPWIMLRAGILGVMWKEGWGWWWRLRGVGKANLRRKAIAEGEEAFTVFLVATDERARGKGCASGIMRSFQDVARKEGKPIWLDTTSAYACGLYEKLGFEKVGEEREGVGIVNEWGKLTEAGEGFVDRGMVWRPEEYVRPI